MAPRLSAVSIRPLAERGYTLMELVVASMPLALVAFSLFAAFQFTVTFSRRGEAGVEAVQQARQALHVMANELREASAAPGAIVIWSREQGDAFDGLGFLSARVDGPGRAFVTDPHGTPRWHRVVYYVHDHVRGELRRLVAESMALAPTTLAPTSLSLPPSTAGAGAAGRTMARQVKRLHPVRHDDLVTITLTVAKPSGEVVLETAVRPRN